MNNFKIFIFLLISIFLTSCVTTENKTNIIIKKKKFVFTKKTTQQGDNNKSIEKLLDKNLSKKEISEKVKKDIIKEFKIDKEKEEIKKEVLEINDKIFIKQPIEIVLNKKVKKFIRLYSYRNGRWLYTAFKNARIWLPYMRQIFKEYGLPEELVYLSLIESHFNFQARSKAGAVGLWQFMRRTGKKYGLKINWWIDERKDPIKSTVAAAKYLKDLYNMFGSYDLALAAYNAGEYKIKRLISRTNKKNYWKICKRRYLKNETISYVPSFYAVLYLIRNNDKFQYIPDEWLNYSKKDIGFVQISKPYSLFKFSKEAGIKLSILRKYNPELSRFCTPPNYENYILKIPKNIENKAIIIAKNINKNYRFSFKVYTIKKGDTLIKIAKRFRIYPLSLLKNFNQIKNVRALRIGKKILLPYPKEYSIKYTKYAYSKRSKKRSKYVKYRVRKGDSLWKVAKKFNVSINNIRMINGKFSKKIYPGDVLVIKKH